MNNEVTVATRCLFGNKEREEQLNFQALDEMSASGNQKTEGLKMGSR